MCVGRGVAYVGGASMTMSGCSSACFFRHLGVVCL